MRAPIEASDSCAKSVFGREFNGLAAGGEAKTSPACDANRRESRNLLIRPPFRCRPPATRPFESARGPFELEAQADQPTRSARFLLSVASNVPSPVLRARRWSPAARRATHGLFAVSDVGSAVGGFSVLSKEFFVPSSS